MAFNTDNKFMLNDVIVDAILLRVKINGTWSPLDAKQLALLKLLAKNSGSAVDRETVINIIWPNLIVSDNSVSQLVAQLRKTLGDSKQRPTFIKTVPRVGYQLIAKVSDVPSLSETVLAPKINRPIYWLFSGVIFGVVAMLFAQWLVVNDTQIKPYKYLSRLTASPGAEVFLRYSPNGRYLAFSHLGKNQAQFDLAVFDSTTNTIHNIKSTGYSEEAPVWSQDGKWLAYYRYDPFSCEIRVIAVDDAIEMWRLGEEHLLYQCDASHGPSKLFWTKDNQLITQMIPKEEKRIATMQLSNEGVPSILSQVENKYDFDRLVDVDLQSNTMYLAKQQGEKFNLFKVDNSNESIKSSLLYSNLVLPTVIKSKQGTLLAGGDNLRFYDGKGSSQVVYEPKGVINEVDVNQQLGDVAHTEGISEVNLYYLDLLDSKAINPIAVSSASKLDIVPEISKNGNWFSFASIEQYSNDENSQVEIWVKHINRPTASLLTMLPISMRPQQLLFSPEANNLLIITQQGHIYLINLFSKKLITIANEKIETRNIWWGEKGQNIYFETNSQGKQWQSWQYNLKQTSRSLISSNSTKILSLAEKNLSFSGFKTDVSQYLINQTKDSIDKKQLLASITLYKPALFSNGIYYVLRKGHQLYLYCYYADEQKNEQIGLLGNYLYDINVPMSLSTNWQGSRVLLNKVDAIESDIILHRFAEQD